MGDQLRLIDRGGNYHGTEGQTWFLDTRLQKRKYPSLRHIWELELTGANEITLKAGSLQNDGQTITWPDTIYTLNPSWTAGMYYDTNDGGGNIYFQAYSDGNGGISIVQLIIHTFYDENGNHIGDVIPFHVVGEIAENGQAVEAHASHTWTTNFAEGDLSENDPSQEGTAAGDPFIVPIL